jgi:glycosyltransferase involved in cell wall biosynthesis
VLEAALSGCALVLGDVPALRELWEGAALFVEPGSSDDLERALNLLMNEPKGLRGLGQRARARALLLSPERRAASFLEAYAHMLREPAAATMERQAS